eukprot:6701516-Prymnesium_polylepis.1
MGPTPKCGHTHAGGFAGHRRTRTDTGRSEYCHLLFLPARTPSRKSAIHLLNVSAPVLTTPTLGRRAEYCTSRSCQSLSISASDSAMPLSASALDLIPRGVVRGRLVASASGAGGAGPCASHRSILSPPSTPVHTRCSVVLRACGIAISRGPIGMLLIGDPT